MNLKRQGLSLALGEHDVTGRGTGCKRGHYSGIWSERDRADGYGDHERRTDQTTITGSDVAVTLTAIENGVTGTQAFLDFTFTSQVRRRRRYGNIDQNFTGTFSINSLANGLGSITCREL